VKMGGKYLVLLVLGVVLAFVIYAMIEVEDRYLERRFGLTGAADGAESPEIDNREFSLKLDADGWRKAANQSRLVAAAQDERLWIVKRRKTWDRQSPEQEFQPIFVRGVNLGVALPGCWPTEFKATKEQYYNWLVDIGRMNANAIRIYTILPPEFYEAFSKYNFDHPERHLWLIQGIWAELPESGDFLENAYDNEIKREIRDAVDVIFGQAVIPQRRGHAFGRYAVDVSAHVLAIIFGREWEPHSVMTMDSINADLTEYHGDFFSVPNGSPSECYMAMIMNYIASYETATYRFQHPLSFVNWLPLDPLYHESEWLEGNDLLEYDNDLATLNPMKIHVTPLMRAGYFASYHAYPYYPDFVFNDEKYARSTCGRGRCSYAGYIRDLKRVHTGIPLIIAEYGVPSSRGASHYTPEGMNHGQHSEIDQGMIDAHLTEDIARAGCAGAILFSWIDEWFKHNWLVMDYEIPADRSVLWYNLENPEQHFGLAALEDRRVIIDGNDDDWRETAATADKTGDVAAGSAGYFDLREVRITSDGSCLYLNIALNEPIDPYDEKFWNTFRILIAIDTHDEALGEHLISPIGQEIGRGAEFLVQIGGPGDSRVLVDNYYDIYNGYPRDSILTIVRTDNRDGVFAAVRLQANRPRSGLTGKRFPKIDNERGTLRWAPQGTGYSPAERLYDVCPSPNGRSLELRIPWAVLNVSDPSSRSVLKGRPDREGAVAVQTESLRFYFFTFDPSESPSAARDMLPDNPLGGGLAYSWETWDVPEYEYRLKEGYPIVAEAFADADRWVMEYRRDSGPRISPGAEINIWPDARKAAGTVTFDDGSIGQYDYAVPLLIKYRLGATFFIVSGWTEDISVRAGEDNGLQVHRLSWPQIRQIAAAGFEIGSHGTEHKPFDSRLSGDLMKSILRASKQTIEKEIGRSCVSISFPYSVVDASIEEVLAEAGFRNGRRGGDKPNPPLPPNPFRLYSYCIMDSSRPTPAAFKETIEQNENQWTILLFHHILADSAREWTLFRHHGVKDTYSMKPTDLERYLRLFRNSGYAIESLGRIMDYIRAREGTKIEFGSFGDDYLIRLIPTAGRENDSTVLSVNLTTPWKIIEVTGAVDEGIYNIRNGRIDFDARPGSTILVRNLEKDIAPFSAIGGKD